MVLSLKKQSEPPKDSHWDDRTSEDLRRFPIGISLADLTVPGTLVVAGVAVGIVVAYLADVTPAGANPLGSSVTIGVMAGSGILAFAAIYATVVAARRFARTEVLRLEIMLTESRLDRLHTTAQEKLSRKESGLLSQ